MGYLSETKRIDKDDACAILGVSDKTFEKLGVAPDDVDGPGGKLWFLLDDILELRDSRLEQKLEKKWAKSAPVFDEDGEIIDETIERKRKLKAERIWQEIKNAEALGELAPIDLMTSVMRDGLQAANAWLESIPARIKRVWPDTPGVVLDTIERECATVRNSIADARIDYTDARMAEYREKPASGDEADT